MGLPRKKRRRRLALPEYVGLVLLVVSMGICALWWLEHRNASWPRATAQLVTLARPAAGGSATARPNQLAVAYQYDVAGTTYSGNWNGARNAAPFVDRIPKHWLALLDAHPRVQINELLSDPGRALELLESADPDNVPEDLKAELKARGYRDVNDIRQELQDGAETTGLDKVRRTLDGGDAPPEPPAAAPTPTAPNANSVALPIRYDPRFPWRSIIERPGPVLRWPQLTLVAAALLLTLTYFALLYPAWKRKGY